MSGRQERCHLSTWICLFACIFSVLGDEPYIPTIPPIPVVARTPKPNDKLHLVQVVWRHGDRAPVMTYPTDVHQEDAWPNGWGELTEVNIPQDLFKTRWECVNSNALGNVLESAYNRVTSFSTSSLAGYFDLGMCNRTLISAYSNIAGMFSGGEAGKDFPNETNWPSGWTPVPVHTLPTDEDHAGNVFAPCPRAVQLDDELRNSKEFKQIAED
ncbi:hypothetical protein OSTOST_03532, partial [Ostertagia ostertagi]